ncbi:T9SS type A sorting domain-containing protein [Spirosoma agri]|uniref:T9SS type A sorting domain-containing protein n=1 Tax=Spirosoma agri TaxID=1987381 RepID=A0A6M0IE61_9BACT|nr:sialate O-acetylesterase [Spirosoma agri]NEU65631.1 T9SS type A sorting domain-containing protein [Spirosoma agri]
MKKYYNLFTFLIVTVLFVPLGKAQTADQVVKITYPESRAIFQRGNDNTSTIYVSGNYYQPVDSIQARVVAEASGQGISTEWATIQRNPQGGVFQSSLRAQGGWYRLEIQVFSGGVILGSDVIRKVGVGEVFIITGQSNAQGFQNFGAVGAADDRVNCVTYDNSTANSLADPPAPTFQQLSATSLIGPRGQSAWCWGVLGDLIAKQYNVPVLFMNTAWQATVINNWKESSDGIVTKNIFALGTPNENFPAGMPYANLLIALRYYCSLQGLRAVLWQQGENDNVPLHSTRKAYNDGMQYLVNKTRADTDRYPAWVLARSSYNMGQVSQEIIQAQNDVINTYNNNVFAGPFTDNIQIPRFEGDVHFGGDGLKQLGQAWFNSLNAIFFATSRPLTPLPSPTVRVACGTNSSLTLSLPDLYKSYTWNTGQTAQSITVNRPGVYRAILKDRTGNTYLSPPIDVQGIIQPTVPAISLSTQPGQVAASQQQICADSAITLTAVASAGSVPLWSTGVTSNTIALKTSGTYSVQGVNVYGCRSAQSSSITLTVRPKLAVPTVEQVGTYALRADMPASTGGQNDAFDWRRANEVIPQTTAEVKVIVTGSYSARAKTTFALANTPSLTCYSDFSAPKQFTFDQTTGGISVYPNPVSDGVVTIETIENLTNALVTVYTLTGQELVSYSVPIFDERKLINLTGLAQGVYIIGVRSAGFNVSRRIVVAR